MRKVLQLRDGKTQAQTHVYFQHDCRHGKQDTHAPRPIQSQSVLYMREVLALLDRFDYSCVHGKVLLMVWF